MPGTRTALRSTRCRSREFDLDYFNHGDYERAVSEKDRSETISKVLYPNDNVFEGRELRLKQEYFFVAATLQDIMRRFKKGAARTAEPRSISRPPSASAAMSVDGTQMAPGPLSFADFHDRVAVQLNDTHPAIAVAELMRLLVDEHAMGWDKAWDITRRSFGYTNHTLLPEALERWPLAMFAKLLPRHLEIVHEINARFLDEARIRCWGDDERIARLSLIDEGGERYVRMANLACVGSHAINGVAELHSELLKRDVLQHFHALWPEKFGNKTNGVTPRRWIALSNPRLARLITEAIGEDWVTELDQLARLEPLAEDTAFRERWHMVKRANKAEFAAFVQHRVGIAVDPQSLFDVQVKRIHEYKRQHLNILHVIAQYVRIKSGADGGVAPRTFVFGGKAAPGYHMAKLIIRLINGVSEVVERDREARERLRVVFLPNYNVSSGQRVYPAADLSEQISTAGKEASGTGNMKFSLNGALTIGTLDGANLEIREEVGADNFFLFGLTAEEVAALKSKGYRPMDLYRADPELREVIDLIGSGFFGRGDAMLFRPLVDNLLLSDPYLVLADFRPYAECQTRVGEAYGDPEHWTRMSILNTARCGKFSSDRTIHEYCRDIWHVEPVPIRLLSGDEVKAGFLQ